MTAFPLGLQCPVEHDGALPDAVDVAIVGGGIIGVMSAYFLAQKGLKVAVLEKGRVAAEQSGRNWGWVRAQGRDMAELPIMLEARKLWEQLQRECQEDLGLKTVGITYLTQKSSEMVEYEAWLTQARGSGIDSVIFSGEQVSGLMPKATQRFAGALHTPSDMKAEPWVAVPAMARAAVRAGAKIFENCAVRALDIQAGRVAGVQTEKGLIRADEVLVAGGAWSSLFLRRHGVSVPQLSVHALVLATQPAPDIEAPAAALSGLAFRRRADGGYTIAAGGWHQLHIGPDAFRAFSKFIPQLRADFAGTRFSPAAPKGYPDGWGTARRWRADAPSPFEAMRVLNPSAKMGPLKRAITEFERLFPQLGRLEIKSAWGGMIDTMPDVVPVVDRASQLPGLSVCTGMSGHGFGIGPAFGRIMADMITGGEIGHDLTRFRMNRFQDGSKIELGPII